MSQWLIDTLVWTGAAMVLVLALRRPVAKHFGPTVAYTLWAVPLARLLLPPFVLPARFAPASAVEAEPLLAVVSQAANGPAVTGAVPAFPWAPVVLALWLGGAAAFLVFRLHQYRAMRRDLLADARPVGEAGAVRLVETPAVDAPVAFGVRDKVVALPLLFMAHPDRAARDLAIAHELAHHRGHDLLANMAAQPLLALHWFNPVAWAAWRAMRRDQEAACDARVVAGLARSQRATYASVIAGFATSQHLALAAPMACPVLGEKSIIHRLRTLTHADVSSARRKVGIAAITTTALVAMPLTASISYAQPDEAQDIPGVPATVVIAPTASGQRDASAALDDKQVQRRIVIRHVGEDTPATEAVGASGGEPDELDAEAIARRAHAAAIAGRRAAEEAVAQEMRVAMQCDGSSPVQQSVTADGRRVTIVCRRAGQASAIEGLREAQRAIRQADGLSAQQRDQIVDELEREIERLEGEEVAISFTLPTLPGEVPAVISVTPVVAVRWSAGSMKVVQPPAPPVHPVVNAAYVVPAPVTVSVGAS